MADEVDRIPTFMDMGHLYDLRWCVCWGFRDGGVCFLGKRQAFFLLSWHNTQLHFQLSQALPSPLEMAETLPKSLICNQPSCQRCEAQCHNFCKARLKAAHW